MQLTDNSFHASHIDPELVPAVVKMCLRQWPLRTIRIEPVMLMGEDDSYKVAVYGRHGPDSEPEYVEL